MDALRIEVTGLRQVGLRFEEFPDNLYGELRTEIYGLTEELLGLVEGATPELSGKLRGQERMRVFADKDHIKGQVFIAGTKGSQDFAKAAALEYGAHNAAKVKAHRMRLDHAWDVKLSAPEMVMVSAYSRTPNIEEHRFERGPLAEMQPEILERLNAVVAKGVAEANA